MRIWLFTAAVASLVAAQVILQIRSVRLESQTWDEAFHISAGYTSLVTGDYRLDPEHPPLARLINAVGLLPLRPDPMTSAPEWGAANFIDFSRNFVYKNRAPAFDILFAARRMTILLTAILGFAVAFWTRARFGAGAALAATAFCTLDPNLTAHGRYVTTDLAAALTFFLATIAMVRYFETGSPRHLALLGISLGLALATKHSNLLLLPAFLLLCLLRPFWKRAAWRWERTPMDILATLFLAGLVVLAVYWPDNLRMFQEWSSGDYRPLQDAVLGTNPLSNFLRWTGESFLMPAHRYLVGLSEVANHNELGHPSYILGVVHKTGVWYYFPFAFLVKTPLAVLTAILLAVIVSLRTAWSAGLKNVRFEWAVYAVVAAVFWAVSIKSRINIGLRHLLPVFPLLHVALAGILWVHGRAWMKKTAAAATLILCGLLAFESWSIYPDYLAFFNLAAGGPANGVNLLVDSNLDWGQDVLKLKRWMDERNVRDVCIKTFSFAPPEMLGLGDMAIAPTFEIRRGDRTGCRYAAVSATALAGVYNPREWYDWLRERKPAERIGWTIYIYDITDVADPAVVEYQRKRLGQEPQRSGKS